MVFTRPGPISLVSKARLDRADESGLGCDISTTRARRATLRGSAAMTSRVWLMAPKRFGHTTMGVACNLAMSSRALKSSPNGLSNPPAPSTIVTSKRRRAFCRWFSTFFSRMNFPSRRAASSGVKGAAKCQGLISSSGMAPPSATRSADASSRPPEQNGLSAPTDTPASRQQRASNTASTVLPTPVSVPVMKSVTRLMSRSCKHSRRWRARAIGGDHPCERFRWISPPKYGILI